MRTGFRHMSQCPGTIYIQRVKFQADIQRMNKANKELAYASEFDHILINDNLEKAIEEAMFKIQEFLTT